MRQLAAIILTVMMAGIYCSAQEKPAFTAADDRTRQWNDGISEDASSTFAEATRNPSEYRIGSEDLIDIAVFEVPDLNRSVRVSAAGEISLPLVGSIAVAGLTPMQMEQKITETLRGYLKDPQVSVFVKEYKSDPVSVIGAVKAPGLYQIQTRKNLIEVLAMAQGLSDGPQRLPGQTILISRKISQFAASANGDDRADAGSARGAESGVVEVPIRELLQTGDPKWNVPVYPGDVVRVVFAGTFYVAGDVNRPGGFPLTDFDTVSAVQALAMAGGTLKSANLKNASVIRRDAKGNRSEEQIDMKEVLRGKDSDLRLGANDILFIPGSASKAAVLRGIEASMQVATGIAVWRVP